VAGWWAEQAAQFSRQLLVERAGWRGRPGAASVDDAAKERRLNGSDDEAVPGGVIEEVAHVLMPGRGERLCRCSAMPIAITAMSRPASPP
jgi:hypothetical protein